MTAPNRNAPKMAWIPIRSVARALNSTPTNRATSTPAPSSPRSSCQSASFAIVGRTATIINAMNAPDRPIVTTALAAPWARAMATTTARRHHAVTSSTAAHVSVTVPSRVGPDRAEQARPEHHAGDDAADDLRLVDPTERGPDESREHDDHRGRHQQSPHHVLARNTAGGFVTRPHAGRVQVGAGRQEHLH